MITILNRRARTDASSSAGYMYGLTRRDLMAASALGLLAGAPRLARAAAPQGQLTWAVHVSLAPTWFDPAETQALITPFMVLYALHDAMVKPMPGTLQAPCLAESWQMSEDGITWDFTIRDGAKFHNGAPVTAEDVKFSFERYRGANQGAIKERVAAIETPDARHVRFRLHKPWPDFLTFYSSASGAGWIVPKKYVEEVGDEGFRKAPIGAGPYKFVSFTPGIELVLEAFDGYWRKTPNVKRLVLKSIPDETTRLAALKGEEVDIAYSIRGELAAELERMPGLSIQSVVLQAPNWIYFPEQFDPKSPWHKLQVRQAANLAIDREGMNKALFLGFCKTNNSIIPETFEYYWQPPQAVFDPGKARKLLAEAGYPNGFDAGPFSVDSSYSNIGEVSVELAVAGGHPHQAAAARARRVRICIRQQEIRQGHTARRERRVRQRRDAAGLVRRQGRLERLRQLSGNRRALPAAVQRTRREKARGDPAQDAATRIREGDLRADLAARLSQRDWAAGRPGRFR